MMDFYSYSLDIHMKDVYKALTDFECALLESFDGLDSRHIQDIFRGFKSEDLEGLKEKLKTLFW